MTPPSFQQRSRRIPTPRRRAGSQDDPRRQRSLERSWVRLAQTRVTTIGPGKHFKPVTRVTYRCATPPVPTVGDIDFTRPKRCTATCWAPNRLHSTAQQPETAFRLSRSRSTIRNAPQQAENAARWVPDLGQARRIEKPKVRNRFQRTLLKWPT